MAYISAMKLILYFVGNWKLFSWLYSLTGKNFPLIKIKLYDPSGVRCLVDRLDLQMGLGKHIKYLIDDYTTDEAILTSNSKEAATARALGKTVFIWNFDRYNNFVQFKSCNASIPGRNYNFLTDTFEGQVDESKDVYVQHIQTK